MKRLVCVLLALALCLGLGGAALAGGEDDGPVLPRLDVYLEEYEDYEEGVSDSSDYDLEGLEIDPFSWEVATVALEDIDKALGYMTLLEEGPFDLELGACLALCRMGRAMRTCRRNTAASCTMSRTSRASRRSLITWATPTSA